MGDETMGNWPAQKRKKTNISSVPPWTHNSVATALRSAVGKSHLTVKTAHRKGKRAGRKRATAFTVAGPESCIEDW